VKKKTMKDFEFYHVFTKGTPFSNLYETEEDFIIGMNSLPLCLKNTDATLLASTLKDSHEHHVIKGSYDDCATFLSQHVRHAVSVLAFRRKKQGLPFHKPGSDGVQCSILPIDSEKSLRQRIAYVMANSFDSGLALAPWWDPWCTASVYFADEKQLRQHGTLIRDIPARQRKLLSKRFDYPDDWKIDERGLIPPCYYIDYPTVNRLFRNPSWFVNYIYYSINAAGAAIEEEIGRAGTMVHSIQELRPMAARLSLQLFGTENYPILGKSQKLFLAKRLTLSCHARPSQLQRLLNIPTEELRTYLDTH